MSHPTVEVIDTCYGKLRVCDHEVCGWPYIQKQITGRVDVYVRDRKGECISRASFHDPARRLKDAYLFSNALAQDIGAHQFGASCSTKVSSSNVSLVAPVENDLLVEYKNGSVYLYVGAHNHLSGIVKAASAGKYINKHLKTDEIKYILLRR